MVKNPSEIRSALVQEHFFQKQKNKFLCISSSNTNSQWHIFRVSRYISGKLNFQFNIQLETLSVTSVSWIIKEEILGWAYFNYQSKVASSRSAKPKSNGFVDTRTWTLYQWNSKKVAYLGLDPSFEVTHVRPPLPPLILHLPVQCYIYILKLLGIGWCSSERNRAHSFRTTFQ